MWFESTLLGSYELAVIVKMLLAVIAGGIIGFEREKHGRPAGLRTHLLVSAGACLMMIISEAFFIKYGGMSSDGVVRLDPSRTAAQIVTGIGFLGAGVIIKEGFIVRGLTTAASLWMVAGTGMAFGAGLFSAGVIAVAVALFSLYTMKKVDLFIKRDRYLHIEVTALADHDVYPQLDDVIAQKNMRISNIESDLDLHENLQTYRLVLSRHKKRMGRELSHDFRQIPGVRGIRFW